MGDQIDKLIPTHPDFATGVKNTSWAEAIPPKQGLYDPELEKDSCGVGFAWYV
jgi:glutamate synthase (NADPH/NADH)